MKTSILLFSLWMPVTAVAFPTNAAVIKNDSPRGQARYQSTQLSPSLNIGAEQVVDIHGRNVGIPDDFVVMEVVGGENSVPMQPKPDVRKLNYISGIQHLYQGEHVSLEKIMTMKVVRPHGFQQESAETHSRLHESVITPDPIPVSPHRDQPSESPLTGFRDVTISSVNTGNALTEYRHWTKADLKPFTTIGDHSVCISRL